LALFIVDAYRLHYKRAKPSPPKAFVLASFNDRRNTYIVVGIPPKEHIDDIRKSPFAIAFKESAQEVKARVHHDSFDGGAIEVQKDDFKIWLENLHQKLMFY